MKYLGIVSDPKDLTNKQYVDGKVGEVDASLTALSGRVDTAEDNIQMAESDIGNLQTETNALKTDMATVKGAVTTLQDTYVPNTTKVNGKALSGDITLDASDVGALADTVTYVESVDGASGAVTTDAVKYVNQTLTTAQKTQARNNIGAGTSNFSGNYNDLTNTPTIPEGALIVTITGNDTDEYTADKTFAEITEAYNSGRVVVAKVSSFIYYLSQIGGAALYFSWNRKETYKYIKINASDSITLTGGVLAESPTTLTSTLSAGSTTLTLSNTAITTSSTIDVYTDKWGVNPTDVAVEAGKITLTFDKQSAALGVKVEVR